MSTPEPCPAQPVLLGVFPHPDDESIAAALLFLDAHRRGVATHVVTCTGGEEGENLAGIELDVPLAEQRRGEMADAAGALHLDSHIWLGYRDSGMVDTPANEHADAFTNADLDEAGARLAAVIRDLRPDLVVSDNEQGTYGHPDHVMAHRVTRRAVELAADPQADVPGEPHVVRRHLAHVIVRSRLEELHTQLRARDLLSPFGEDDWPDEFGVGDDAVSSTVHVPDLFAGKRTAMLAHRSQVSEDSAFFNLPDDLYRSTMAAESFAIVSSAQPVDDELRTRLARDPWADVPGVARTVSVEAPDDVAFRQVMGRFATGVTVMTSRTADGEPVGMTANSVSSVSLDPLLVLVCVGRDTSMADHVLAAQRFALSMLPAGAEEISNRFADPTRCDGWGAFEGLDPVVAATGSPVLGGALAWVDCRVHAVHDGGDHHIVVGEVVASDTPGDGPALGYFRSDYVEVSVPEA